MSSNATPSVLRDKAPVPLLSADIASGLAIMVVAALAMSISPSLVRLADVGPFASAFWRVFLALPVLWVWMRRDEGAMSHGAARPRVRFASATVLAGLCFSGDLFFWHLSVMHTTVANATFFATTAPIWVVLFGWLFLRQAVGRSVVFGLGLCILGGAALVSQSFAFAPDRAFGDGLGLVTGIFFGLYFLAVGAARGRSGAARVTFELSVITAAVLFCVAWMVEPRMIPKAASGWGVLLTLALVSHAGGQGLLSVALGRLPAVFSSLVIFLEAIAAAAFAWLLLGEGVTLVQVLGGIVIVVGIWIARPRQSRAVTPQFGGLA